MESRNPYGNKSSTEPRSFAAYVRTRVVFEVLKYLR
jgi:hypothetical protein